MNLLAPANNRAKVKVKLGQIFKSISSFQWAYHVQFCLKIPEASFGLFVSFCYDILKCKKKRI